MCLSTSRQIEALANQLRSVQKRLLSRYREKNPAPLQSLDVLLDHTLIQIFELSERRQEYERINHRLFAEVLAGWKLLLLLRLKSQAGMKSSLFKELLQIFDSCSSTGSEESSEAVGWVESCDMLLCQMLRTTLAKSSKDQTGINLNIFNLYFGSRLTFISE